MEIRSLSEPTISQGSLDLHRRCCSDDPVVVDAAFQQLGNYLYRVAYARLQLNTHRAELAHESVQQALAAIWQRLSEGRGPNHVEWFLSWCASIVIHKMLDELRKEGRTRRESLDELMDADDSSLLQIPDSQAPVPDRQALDSEATRHLIELIQNHPHLNDEAKFVLLYGYLLEWEDAALAQALDKERASIRVIRFRALKILRNDPDFIVELTSMR